MISGVAKESDAQMEPMGPVQLVVLEIESLCADQLPHYWDQTAGSLLFEEEIFRWLMVWGLSGRGQLAPRQDHQGRGVQQRELLSSCSQETEQGNSNTEGGTRETVQGKGSVAAWTGLGCGLQPGPLSHCCRREPTLSCSEKALSTIQPGEQTSLAGGVSLGFHDGS